MEVWLKRVKITKGDHFSLHPFHTHTVKLNTNSIIKWPRPSSEFTFQFYTVKDKLLLTDCLMMHSLTSHDLVSINISLDQSRFS